MEVKILDDTKHTGSPTESFMKLLSVATGDYVMFSDQDDMWYRRKTEATFAKMKKCEEKYGKDTPILVHTDLSLMDEDGRKIAESFFDYLLTLFMECSSLAITIEVYIAALSVRRYKLKELRRRYQLRAG